MAKKYYLKNKSGKKLIHIFFILFSLLFILPFIYVISISLSNEQNLIDYGYRLIPKTVDFTAYNMIFANPKQLIDSYKVTIMSTVVGSFVGVLIMALVAYPLSRSNFKYRKIITFYIFFTMIFGGGLIPTYILCTQYLHIGNSFWIYMAIGLANAWYIIIIKTFFQSLPVSLIESAKIDGASELRIFFKIVLPLSKPVIATVGILTVLLRWNDWNTSLIYIQKPSLYSLQYLLQRILREAEFVKSLAQLGISTPGIATNKIPTEAMRFGMAIVAAGPMLIVFPFFQKYFTKGLTVGAVKG